VRSASGEPAALEQKLRQPHRGASRWSRHNRLAVSKQAMASRAVFRSIRTRAGRAIGHRAERPRRACRKAKSAPGGLSVPQHGGHLPTRSRARLGPHFPLQSSIRRRRPESSPRLQRRGSGCAPGPDEEDPRPAHPALQDHHAAVAAGPLSGWLRAGRRMRFRDFLPHEVRWCRVTDLPGVFAQHKVTIHRAAGEPFSTPSGQSTGSNPPWCRAEAEGTRGRCWSNSCSPLHQADQLGCRLARPLAP